MLKHKINQQQNLYKHSIIKPRLVTLYDIQPRNSLDLFLQLRDDTGYYTVFTTKVKQQMNIAFAIYNNFKLMTCVKIVSPTFNICCWIMKLIILISISNKGKYLHDIPCHYLLQIDMHVSFHAKNTHTHTAEIYTTNDRWLSASEWARERVTRWWLAAVTLAAVMLSGHSSNGEWRWWVVGVVEVGMHGSCMAAGVAQRAWSTGCCCMENYCGVDCRLQLGRSSYSKWHFTEIHNFTCSIFIAESNGKTMSLNNAAKCKK